MQAVFKKNTSHEEHSFVMTSLENESATALKANYSFLGLFFLINSILPVLRMNDFEVHF